MPSFPELDPLIHAPKRLEIMAILSVSLFADFQFLQEQLSVSASVLSKHMSVLTEAEYVKVKKIGHGRSGLTRYSMTQTGKKAYDHYCRTISALLNLPNKKL